jgi:hypothetical protein
VESVLELEFLAHVPPMVITHVRAGDDQIWQDVFISQNFFSLFLTISVISTDDMTSPCAFFTCICRLVAVFDCIPHTGQP